MHNPSPASIDRRQFLGGLGAAATLSLMTKQSQAGTAPSWQPRYVLASCLFGTMKLAEILPHVHETGAAAIDLWPRIHGRQREEIDAIGHDVFAAMLAEHKLRLAVLTRYDLGPFRLSSELAVAEKFKASVIVCASEGPAGLQGDALKRAIRDFLERLQPTLAEAEKRHVKIGIENHANSLIHSPDSIRWLAEFSAKQPVGIALAPYHLPQAPPLIAQLISDLGEKLTLFYAWQHGKGSTGSLSIDDQLQQLPGRGGLDFGPIVDALSQIQFSGFTEIFMHSTPRGVPVLPSAIEITAEINRARAQFEMHIPSSC